jgi:mRNA interferase MazF
MERGKIWGGELPAPPASAPGVRRPVAIVKANAFNRSRIRTGIDVVLTPNLRLAEAPGNVLIHVSDSGLPKDSVANFSQVITVDRTSLTERCGRLPAHLIRSIDDGLRLVLSL